MTPSSSLPKLPAAPVPQAVSGKLRVGMDIVQISRIRESLEQFGHRFQQRLFTANEIAYGTRAGQLGAERFAARFAAKEAAIKAFGLSEAGLDWRCIEVVKLDDGSCRLALHGGLAEFVGLTSPDDVSISLSHDGDYATAVVTALISTTPAYQ